MRKLCCALGVLFVLLSAPFASADATFGQSSSTKDVTGTASSSTLATVNCGSGNLCKFTLVWRQTAAQTANTPTYGGSTAGITLISPTIPMGGSATGCVDGGCIKVWYACNLAGIQDVVFSLSAAGNMFASVSVYSGVDCGGTPVGTSVQSDSQADGMSQTNAGPTSVTTMSGGLASDSLYVRDDVLATNVPGAGQVQRESQQDSGSISLWTSDEVDSTGMSWDWSPGIHAYVHIVVPINPSTGGGGGGGTVNVVNSYSAKDATLTNATLTIASVDAGAGNFVKFNLVWRQNAGQTFSSLTYGGSATGITAITPMIGGGGASDGCDAGGCARTWYACGLTGVQNVVFTMSAATNTFASVHVYSGVDCAGTPVGTSVQNDSMDTGTASSVSTNITTNSGGVGSDVLYVRDDLAGGNTPTAGQTQRETESDSGSIGLWSSNEPASTNMGWTWTGALAYTHIATPINAGAAAPACRPGSRMLLGVGC